MSTASLHSSRRTNAGKTYHRQGPLTVEQGNMITEWWHYATTVGWRARPPWRTDPDSVRDAITDGLIQAVRYWQPGRGCRSLRSWVVWCVRTRVRQRPHRTVMSQHTQRMRPCHDVIAPVELSPTEEREYLRELGYAFVE